jgi:chitinase
MFLAQILHESGGLRYKRELACINTGCPNDYQITGPGIPGKRYYGRGYIQLV